nr:unnamed protein product [Spirometra erinaceieuropaei]
MLLKCSYCLRKISEFSISCEQCVNVILCHDCFRSGAECGKHKRSHRYSIQQCPGTKEILLFSNSWLPEMELALLDNIESSGLGNCIYDSATPPVKVVDDLTDFQGEQAVFSRPPSLEDCKIIGFMHKRNEFECEFDNDAETTLSQIRHEFDDDPLFRELVLARIDMFVERLRRRHQCHVIASKLNLLTHFMPDLRPLARASPGVGLTKTLPGKRLTFASQSGRTIGSSPIPSDSHSSIGVCDGDVIGSCRRTVRSTNHRRRRPIIRGSARTAHLKRLRLEVERRTAKAAAKATASAKLTPFSSQFLPTPAGATVESNAFVSLNPSPSLHHSPVTACTPSSTGDQVVKGEGEGSECNLPSVGEDYHDSGLGSSECSLHSTFSTSSSTENSDSMMSALSKQPSPLKGDQEIEVNEQGCPPPSPPNAIFTLETTPRRRHSHPLISPLLRTDPVFSVSNAPLSCSRESSSTVVSAASFSVTKKPTAHVFPDDPRRARLTRGGFPNPKSAQNCCTPRCIAEPLKPFLRFLSASEAHMLLSELHREHILRQQVDQLEQLRFAGSDNFQNARLDGTKLDADSDSDDSMSTASSMATAATEAAQPARPLPSHRPVLHSDPKNTPPSPSSRRPAAASRLPAGKAASAPTVFRRPRGRPPLLHRRALPSRLDDRGKIAVTASATAASSSSKRNSLLGGHRRGRLARRGTPAFSSSSSARLSRGGGRRASLSSPPSTQ